MPAPALPPLSEEPLGRLRAYGDAQDLEVGDTLFETGDPSYDLIVIEDGAIELDATGP
jgi:CRP-like cAMP-binding protein